MVITLVEKTLSDGSKVYDVLLNPQRLHAVTEADATDLMFKIRKAIEDHTTDLVECDFNLIGEAR